MTLGTFDHNSCRRPPPSPPLTFCCYPEVLKVGAVSGIIATSSLNSPHLAQLHPLRDVRVPDLLVLVCVVPLLQVERVENVKDGLGRLLPVKRRKNIKKYNTLTFAVRLTEYHATQNLSLVRREPAIFGLREKRL